MNAACIGKSFYTENTFEWRDLQLTGAIPELKKNDYTRLNTTCGSLFLSNFRSYWSYIETMRCS